MHFLVLDLKLFGFTFFHRDANNVQGGNGRRCGRPPIQGSSIIIIIRLPAVTNLRYFYYYYYSPQPMLSHRICHAGPAEIRAVFVRVAVVHKTAEIRQHMAFQCPILIP